MYKSRWQRQTVRTGVLVTSMMCTQQALGSAEDLRSAVGVRARISARSLKCRPALDSWECALLLAGVPPLGSWARHLANTGWSLSTARS